MAMGEQESTADTEFLTRVHVLLLDMKSMISTLQTQCACIRMDLNALRTTTEQGGSSMEHSQAKVAFDHDHNLT